MSFVERYSRQLLLDGFGTAGQEKLARSKVLVIGAGGLGCPALQYLAGAGIGRIGIVDDDVVSVSNLHRQILYHTADTGQLKALVAQQRLQALNPDARIDAYPVCLDNSNALGLLAEYDLVIDGSDNFETRYLVNDACVLLGKPLVTGAVSRFEGQVAVLNAPGEHGLRLNYRHLFPEAPAAGSIADCATAGVLGVLTGIIGSMQAAETVKWLTGLGQPLVNTLLVYDLLRQSVQTFRLTAQPLKHYPRTEAEFLAFDYSWFCGARNEAGALTPLMLERMLATEAPILVDVREQSELPAVTGFPCLRIPLGALERELPRLKGRKIVFLCQSGQRSRHAAALYRERIDGAASCYTLSGGIPDAPFLYQPEHHAGKL